MPTWATYSTPDITPQAIVGLIALGSGRVLMFGTAGTILRSTDNGQTWTLLAAPEANDIVAMAHDGAGTVVAVCATGTHRAFVSTDDGATWASKSLAEANTMSGIGYSSALGLFFAVSTDGTHQVQTSTDGGNSWTARTASSANGWYGTAENSTQLASIDATAGNSMGSADGTTWADGATFTVQTGFASTADFTYSPLLGKFVAAGIDVPTLKAKLGLSSDLSSWSYLSGGTLDSYGVASCVLPADAIGGLVISLPYAAGFGSTTPTIIGYSTDAGVTWTADDTTFSGSWFAGCWDDASATAIFWDNAGTNTVLVGSFAMPTFTSVSPTSGTVLGGTLVTCTGTGLTGVTDVKFDGTSATDVTVVDDETVICRTPAHAEATVDVEVVGVATLAGSYTYRAVLSIRPNSGTILGGTPVTIFGGGFLSATGVTFDGTAAVTYEIVSDTTITAVTPGHPATGAVDVGITMVGTLTGGYTYTPVRRITLPPVPVQSNIGQGGSGSGGGTMNTDFLRWLMAVKNAIETQSS